MTFIYFILCLLRHLLITIKICGFVKNTHFTIKILADPLIIHYSKFLTGIIRKNLNRYEYFQTCIWTRSLILVMSLPFRRMNINVWQVRNPGKFWLKNVFYFISTIFQCTSSKLYHYQEIQFRPSELAVRIMKDEAKEAFIYIYE